jgi:hypothetical protein
VSGVEGSVCVLHSSGWGGALIKEGDEPAQAKAERLYEREDDDQSIAAAEETLPA